MQTSQRSECMFQIIGLEVNVVMIWEKAPRVDSTGLQGAKQVFGKMIHAIGVCPMMGVICSPKAEPHVMRV